MANRQGLWLFVAKPRQTQDPDGFDAPWVEPGYRSPDDSWWTCSQETQDGDLALLYETAPGATAVRWLLKTYGNARNIADEPHARREGWHWGTGYEVLARFDNPLAFAEMSNSHPLAGWDAIHRNLHGGHVVEEPGVWPVPIVYWRAMVTRLTLRNPGTKVLFARHMHPAPSWLLE